MSNFQTYKDLIKQHDVISFDLFDTLLIRSFIKPNDLFYYLERKFSCLNFATNRENAEKIYYSKNTENKEANIDDIYNNMNHRYRFLKKVELNYEYNDLEERKDIKLIYEYARNTCKRIIIVTDTYFKRDFILNLLNKNNYKDFYKVYISNELNKRKDNGSLWRYILDDLGVSPDRIIHFGDNRRSDVIIASKFSIKGIFIKKISKQFFEQNKVYKNFYKQNKQSEIIPLVCGLLAKQKFLYPNMSYWESIGYQLAGPLGLSYCAWILDSIYYKYPNISTCLFVARDGYILKEIFDKLLQARSDLISTAGSSLYYIWNEGNAKGNKRETKYFYAPRLLINKFFNLDKINKALKSDELDLYSKYLKDNFKDNKTCVIDTIGGSLSAQRAIENIFNSKVVGFYWLTLRKYHSDSVNEFVFEQHTHSFYCKNNMCDFVEFMFTAPELPIIGVQNLPDGRIVPKYQQNISEFEQIRIKIAEEIKIGACRFVDDYIKTFGDTKLYFNSFECASLVDSFIRCKSLKDIDMFSNIYKSPFPDNSKYVPLLSSKGLNSIHSLKRLVWKTYIQKVILCLAYPIYVCSLNRHVYLSLFPFIEYKIFEIIFWRFHIVIGSRI